MKSIQTILFACLVFICSIAAEAQEFAKSKIDKKTGNDSETYQSMTFNGAWCWFSDPRAVYYEGEHKRTYAGWVDGYGDVHIGFYDHRTQEIKSKVLYDGLQVDDHNNPSILFDEHGYLLVFFNKHGGPNPLYMMRSTQPESINGWSKVERLALNDTTTYPELYNTYTYTNPIRLSDENRIYLFWRGIDNKPNYSYSDDNGATWSTGKIFILPERAYKNRRPYLKVYSDGKSRIHFTFTDGHPRKEPTNSVYYMYYENGALHKADGTKIGSLDEPVKPNEADIVYDATDTKHKAWVWDVAQDEDGNPAIAYAKFPDDDNHIYAYAKWNKDEWSNHDLINAGGWFPDTPEGEVEREPNYSGGLSIDKEDPGTLYLSVKRDSIFEIEQWTTKNNGKSWKSRYITKGSSKNNVRPFAIQGAKEDNPLQVLWMQNTHYEHFENFLSSIKMNIQSPGIEEALDPVAIELVMRQAADWHLANPRKHHKLDWHYGALYTGIMALYDLTLEDRYLNELINIGQHYDWVLMDDIYHADRLTVADMYAWIYEKQQDFHIIDKTKWAMDIHLARRYKKITDVTFENNPYRFEWWTWCDALYMAPPSFTRMYDVTGEQKYLDYMNEQYWKTSDYLFSDADSLYFRDDRFFDEQTENGKKMFWARGNGWVIAGIARILEIMPENYPDREKFVQEFREMAYKLLALQRDHGLWTASLLDPEQLPTGESSGSSFFTFALAWGVNNGFLDAAAFEPAVKKAWKALVANVNDEGRLGYVQQVAGSPYPFYEHESQVYATGAFLLAGSEMHKLLSK